MRRKEESCHSRVSESLSHSSCSDNRWPMTLAYDEVKGLDSVDMENVSRGNVMSLGCVTLFVIIDLPKILC